MRLASRHLLSITLISCALFGVSSAFNEQQAVRIDDITPQTTTSVDAVAVTNALSEYYENIVDQVMATLTEEITLSAPRSFMSIHHLGTVHRSKYRVVNVYSMSIVIDYFYGRSLPYFFSIVCACTSRPLEPHAIQLACFDSTSC